MLNISKLRKTMKQRKQTGKGVMKSQVVWLTLISVLLSFAACDRSEEGYGNEENVAVHFSLSASGAWGRETLIRSSSEIPRTEETVIVPLENNWTLEAHLTEDAPSPARSDYEPIADGTKFWIVAYLNDHTVVGNQAYVYNSITQSLSGAAFPLTNGSSYTFVAYSYNSTTEIQPYDNSDAIAVSSYSGTNTPANDLLWGKSSAVTINSSGDNVVAISLAHKFSRIKVQAKITGAITPIISTIAGSLTTNYKGTFTVNTGDLIDPEEEDPQPLAGWTGSGSGEVTSDYSIVYTAEEYPIVRLTHVRIIGSASDKTYEELYIPFKSRLYPGSSYTLQINFKNGITWAGSNIYWVTTNDLTGAGYLTFSSPGATDKQFYQGVFFKWGSLVGISPVQTNNADAFVLGTNPINTNPYTPIYVPYLSSGTDHNNKGAIRWKETNATTSGYNAYDEIPYVNTDGANNPSVNHLASSGVHDPSVSKGDICKYLTGQPNTPAGDWVMPTAADFTSATSAWTGSIPADHSYWRLYDPYNHFPSLPNNAQTGDKSAGNYNGWDWGVSYCDVTVFPASGYRTYDNGMLINTGNYGNYWTSSVSTNTAYYMFFGSYGIYMSNYYREYAWSVRCVLQH
jgi:hypothetical protein